MQANNLPFFSLGCVVDFRGVLRLKFLGENGSGVKHPRIHQQISQRVNCGFFFFGDFRHVLRLIFPRENASEVKHPRIDQQILSELSKLKSSHRTPPPLLSCAVNDLLLS